MRRVFTGRLLSVVIETAALRAPLGDAARLSAEARLPSSGDAASFEGTGPSELARHRLGLAKAHQSGDVSSVPLEPATRFTARFALNEEHVRKPNLSKRLRRDAED
jgi:hypothetical protein